MLIFPTFFASLLGVTDENLMNMSAVAIRLFGVAMPLQLVNTVLLNYYQCTKKVGMATMICVLQSLVYTVLFSFILIRPMGATGVWLAFPTAELVTASVMVFAIVKTWKRK